jgi:hypothetical protein
VTNATQQLLALVVVALATAYLARRAWSTWRAWRAAGDDRAGGCSTGCGCSELPDARQRALGITHSRAG